MTSQALPSTEPRAALGLRAYLPFAMLLALPACADLSFIDQNTCGNRVTEPDNHEECDAATGCHPPGSTFACRFQCASDDDCPSAYRCGRDAVCRAASGNFRVVDEILTAPTVGLAKGDFNGDKRVDLLRESDTTSFVQLYGDGFTLTGIEGVERIPNDVAPMVRDLNGDNRSDLGFSVELGPQGGSGMVVYRASSSGALQSSVYSTLPLPVQSGEEAVVHTFFANVIGPDTSQEILGFGQPFMTGGSRLVGLLNQNQLIVVPLDDQPDVARLAGVGTGRFAPVLPAQPLPCDMVVYAEFDQPGQNRVHIVAPCVADVNGDAMWRDAAAGHPAAQVTLMLPPMVRIVDPNDLQGDGPGAAEPGELPPPKIRSVLFVADVNQDTLDDIVLYAFDVSGNMPMPGVYVALQDGVNGGFTTSTMQQVTLMQAPPQCDPIGPWLAVLDLNDDGYVDVVHESGILINTAKAFNPMTPSVEFRSSVCLADNAWGSVAVADFDGNGTLDVAATRLTQGELFFDKEPLTGIDVRRNDGNGVFTGVFVTTNRPAQQVVGGDFDGDLVNDLVYVEVEEDTLDTQDFDVEDELFVAFGRTFGGFEKPRSLGRLRLVRQLAAGRYEGNDGATDLLALSRPTPGRLAIAPIVGNGSRQLVSPYLFFTGEVALAPTFAEIAGFVGGDFGTGGSAFGVLTRDSGANDAARIWLVEAEGDNVELTSTLSAEFQGSDPSSNFSCDRCTAAAIDLDDDGVDELVTVATLVDPQEGPQGSELRVFYVEDGFVESTDSPSTLPNDLTISAEHFEGPVNVPQVHDLDLDGLKDLLVLGNTDPVAAESSSFAQSELLVFWNAGNGSLEQSAMARVGSPGHDLLGFAIMNVDGDPEPEIVLAVEAVESLPDDDIGLLVLQIDPDARTITPIADAALVSITGEYGFLFPTALMGGDFDGDGVDDIIAGDYLGYQVLKGIPVEP